MKRSTKRILTSILAPTALVACCASVALVQEKPNDKQTQTKNATATVTAAAKDADEEAIRQSATAFITAYNAHDAKAVAKLFALKAEFTDEEGRLIKGREAIEQDFAEMFTTFPECAIEVDVQSVRILTPNVALEEGVVRGQPTPDESPNISSYAAVHVKVDGRWHIASVSDFEVQPQDLTPHEHLQELDWMVGHWLQESPDSLIKSVCRWDVSENYLLHEFSLQIAGQISSSGSMRMGWDPLTKQIKSWTFDADGGYSEALWIHVGDEWIVTSHGVNESGQVTSATNVFRYINSDTMTWRSRDRVVGGQPEEDIPESIIKRCTPSPQL